MIMSATKIDKSSSQPQLPITDKSGKGDTDDFSKLLQSISSAHKADQKTLKEGALALHLDDAKESTTTKADAKESSKKGELLSLLKNDDAQDTKGFIVNPELTTMMDAKSLKNAIKDAREYLKDQIKNSLAYKQGEIKELPKTTKGLVALAKKVGIDVEKITVETIQLKGKKDIKLDDESKIKTILTKDTQKAETKNTTAEIKPQLLQTQQQSDDTSLKKVPLFKLSQNVASSHTTAELVDKKQLKTEKAPEKSDSALKALLHGEKNINTRPLNLETKTESKIESKHKTHSSVLSQLLHGDTSDNKNVNIQTPTDASTVKSAFSHAEHSIHTKDVDQDLGVKINEAKQMVKYLAHDIKQAIEDYKPPFTRIKVKLNPAKFGEVDLTVIQRGKNVHVNISSNSAAINTLAQNANDLKVQLNQNGMNNASLNFNTSSDNQGQQQQQSGHHKENAKKAYEYFDNDEANEEILSSLEIVVPRYI